MIHKILTLIFSLSTAFATAQLIDTNNKPICAVFEYDQKYGIVDTFGNEIVPLGKYHRIYSFTNLSFYLVRANEESKLKDYKFYDATSKKFLEMGSLAEWRPVMEKKDALYFHVIQENKSVVVSPTVKEKFVFDKTYRSIERITLHDTTRSNSHEYFITKDNDYFCTIWSIKDNVISKINKIAPFERFELIMTEIRTDRHLYNVPIGIAIETQIPKSIKAKPENSIYAAIYNNSLTLKTKNFTTEAILTKTFAIACQLGSNISGTISMGSGIIKSIGNDQSVDLNENFAIKRMIKRNHQRYFFATKKGASYQDIIPLESGEPEFVYYNKQKMLKLLLYNKNRMSFIFDYDGIIFPKAKIMIPKSYLEKEKLDMLLPYSL